MAGRLYRGDRRSKRLLDPTSERFCCKCALIGACGWPSPIDRGGQSSYELWVLKIGRLGDAWRLGLEISFCGELASDPQASIALVGLGIEKLSMVPAALTTVKEVLRGVTLGEARFRAAQVIKRTP